MSLLKDKNVNEVIQDTAEISQNTIY
jgi:hypothetical protein